MKFLESYEEIPAKLWYTEMEAFLTKSRPSPVIDRALLRKANRDPDAVTVVISTNKEVYSVTVLK